MAGSAHVGRCTAHRPPIAAACARPGRQRRRAAAARAAPGPEEAFRQACEELGVRYERAAPPADVEDEETWDDILEELEDPWSRDPRAAIDLDQLLPPAPVQAPSAEQPAAPEELSLAELRAETDADPRGVCVLDVSPDNRLARHWAGPGARHLPLERLTRAEAEALAGLRLVAVAGASAIQARQACTRLTRAFGLANVRQLRLP